MCRYCECGDDNEWLIDDAIDCGFLGDIYCEAHINSITEEYAKENGLDVDDFDNKLYVSVDTNSDSVKWGTKIDYCPICGRKLGGRE